MLRDVGEFAVVVTWLWREVVGIVAWWQSEYGWRGVGEGQVVGARVTNLTIVSINDIRTISDWMLDLSNIPDLVAVI